MTNIQLIAILFFTAILFGMIALYLGYTVLRESLRFHLKKRLLDMALQRDERLPSDISKEILEEIPAFDKYLMRFKFIKKLDKLIDNAGLNINVKLFMLIILFSAILGVLVGIVLRRGVIVPVVLTPLFGMIPLFYLMQKKKLRIQRFTEQFPDCLDMIARSLRAGHSLSSAIETIGKEMAEPVAGIFRTAYEEQSLGLSMRDAITRMLDRMESMDLKLFVSAINVHREVGGNLAEMMERLGSTIRERLKIRRQIKVYTAQGRLSGYVLAALPVFMAAVLYLFVAPDYIKELIEVKTGWYMIGYAIVSQIIGFIVIRKLINIRI